MKFLYTAVALFASLAIAEDCVQGRKYCSQVLRNKDDKYIEILHGMRTHTTEGRDPYPEKDWNENGLFTCTYGGGLHVEKFCDDGCQDNGQGNDDSC